MCLCESANVCEKLDGNVRAEYGSVRILKEEARLTGG